MGPPTLFWANCLSGGREGGREEKGSWREKDEGRAERTNERVVREEKNCIRFVELVRK